MLPDLDTLALNGHASAMTQVLPADIAAFQAAVLKLPLRAHLV